MSMRLEKNWGAWTLDYRPDFTAKETGLDAFINWDKEFIGKESAQKEKEHFLEWVALRTPGGIIHLGGSHGPDENGRQALGMVLPCDAWDPRQLEGQKG